MAGVKCFYELMGTEQFTNPITLIATYARVSTAKQEEERTIEVQLGALRDFAREHGYAISIGAEAGMRANRSASNCGSEPRKDNRTMKAHHHRRAHGLARADRTGRSSTARWGLPLKAMCWTSCQ